MTNDRKAAVEPAATPAAPSLAIVIPVYNGRKHLAETLQSCVQQLCPADEIIVVEDGSPKSSRDIVELLPGVRYVDQPNGGVSSARNHGASVATADWICFLDQDDLLLPDHLEQLSKAIQSGVRADLFYTPRVVLSCVDGVWTTRESQSPPAARHLARVLPIRCPFPPSGTCVRRSVFEAAGGFRSRYDLAEDWEFWLRLNAMGAVFHLLPTPTVCYRVHMESNSHRPLPILNANLRVIREQILPSVFFLKRLWVGKRLISTQEADAAILLRQMGQDGGQRLLLRSIVRLPLGNWRRYKIAAHMLTHGLRNVSHKDTSRFRA
ncbi:glycosyltransferase family 2 protein [Terriglobus roseus]|uniref:Glycosyltransferase, GT2 family n=1 Tax=Terriglobus roseus TaxID=392734 RepID=A0A1H4JP21_9BACT|nr:glycosyltransferase [Terriglobus roseus]SEB48064.1 Glycosyltransferase, GT2 family [Terriglobus roseus]